MAKDTGNTRKGGGDEDFKVLGADPKHKGHFLVKINARDAKGEIVGSGEFSMPYLESDLEVHEKYFGDREELLLNAYRNKLVQIRSGLKSEGKKAGRGGLAAALRRKSA